MTLHPEREAQTQADRLHAAGQMTAAEIVQLQDDLAWWKDHSAKLSADFHKLATAMMIRTTMTTPKTWTPPPEMPANLPPLPVGRNGRSPLYIGMGETFKITDCRFNGYFLGCDNKWDYGNWNGLSRRYHYAAESDSEICRLNQWGDFTPPAKPQIVLDVYRADVSAKLDDAAKTVQELRQSLAEWENYHGQLIEAQTQLEEGDSLSRKAWFEAGKKCERQHGKTPTNFPKYP